MSSRSGLPMVVSDLDVLTSSLERITMNIGVIGTGMIRRAVGALWAKAGHLIRFGTRSRRGRATSPLCRRARREPNAVSRHAIRHP